MSSPEIVTRKTLAASAAMRIEQRYRKTPLDFRFGERSGYSLPSPIAGKTPAEVVAERTYCGCHVRAPGGR